VDSAELDKLVAQIGEEIIARVKGAGSTCVVTRAKPAVTQPAASSLIARLIDHTLLKPDAARDDIVRLCGEARIYCFATVCVNPCWVPLAASEVAGTPVKVCTVVGFPLGATATEIKVAETSAMLRVGAQEIDMVMNIGALRSGDYDMVKCDIQAVVAESHKAGVIVKVILETAFLDKSEKAVACSLAHLSGADFVKTSTGFGPAGATAEDVTLMRQVVGPDMGVKAAGGIRTFEDFRKMIGAGANRIGTSCGVKIVAESGFSPPLPY
jgi:deoxyribose-phosphate aldolase